MMNKLKDLWNSSGRRFLLVLPVAAVIITAATGRQTGCSHPPRGLSPSPLWSRR